MNQTSLFLEDSQKISYINKDEKSSDWTNEEKLSNEFNSIGFYMYDHPLNTYKDILKIYHTKTFKEFMNDNSYEAFLAGTIMSFQEKKTSKGNSFAIVKFSDLTSVFELFIFSEILEKNRSNLNEGRSFLVTVVKDKKNMDNRYRRISVRKIVSFQDLTQKNYNEIYIEIDKSDDLKRLSNSIKEKGNSKIKISINDTNKNYLFELKDKRKFDYETLKSLNKEHYIKKIIV